MPGLRLTAKQVQRLCGVDPTLCQAVLDTLVDERFLGVSQDGPYALAGEFARWCRGWGSNPHDPWGISGF
jgi:hypothetical protein